MQAPEKAVSQELTVKCPDCSAEAPLSQVMQEREVTLGKRNLFQIYMRCPHCEMEKHSFYMSRFLRIDQRRLSKSVQNWNREKTEANFAEYEKRHRIFQHNFDTLQVQCRILLQEQVQGEQANS